MERIDSAQYYNHNAERINVRRLSAAGPSDLEPFLRELSKDSQVLDWGCGAGVDLYYIEQAGHHGVGIDASPKMVGFAQKNSPQSKILLKNGMIFSPTPNEFDGVWINESLNALPFEESQRVIALCFKGLKQNGTLGVVVREGQGYFEDREDDLEGPSRTVYLYSEKQLCSMIEQTGFQIMKVGRRADRPGILLLLAKKQLKG